MTVVLAIETSCDETGVGIAQLDADGAVTLLADEVASSVDEHVRFGGVVPEIASRAHLEALGPAMRRALATAGVQKPDIVAATIGPGLAGALLVVRRRRETPFRGPALACLLFTGSAVMILGASDVFEFSWRYQLPAVVTLVPGGALGLTALVLWFRGRRAEPDGAEPAAAAA